MKGSGLRAKGFTLAASALAVAASLVVPGFSRTSQTPAPQPPPTFGTEANYVRVTPIPRTTTSR
jgi:hypothetical protein